MVRVKILPFRFDDHLEGFGNIDMGRKDDVEGIVYPAFLKFLRIHGKVLFRQRPDTDHFHITPQPVIPHRLLIQTLLWIVALRDAVEIACPEGSSSYRIRLMSDNGSQPTSRPYEKDLETFGIDHIKTSYNNPQGNSDAERFFRIFKEEIV
jgi:hypothetical protein